MEKWIPAVWLVLAVILVGIELATPQMVCIWFALGAAVALTVSLTGVPLIGQLAVFTLVSCLALLFSRPLARRLLHSRRTNTNADAVVGMEGVVTEAIDNLHGGGRVQVNGLNWLAHSDTGEQIAQGCSVTVLKIEGVKLIVRMQAAQD